MKLNSLTVQNIRSFEAEKCIEFNEDFTILIGPNAGGKSNILDIVSITLRQFLLRPWGVTRENDAAGPYFQFRSETPFGNIHNELTKFYGATGASRISLKLQLSQQDVNNLKLLIDHRDLLSDTAKRFRGADGDDLQLRGWETNDLTAGDVITFDVQDGNLVNPTDLKTKIFLNYLQTFNKFAILLENEKVRLTSPFVHFPPYRGAPPDGLRMSLASQSRWNYEIHQARATSRQVYSLIPLATFHFSSKHRKFEVGAHSNGYKNIFWAEEEVQSVTQTLKKLGYDWDLTLKDPLQNTYEILLKHNGQQFDISNASSGEKEIINFIFGIFSLNVRNGMVIIDEPELHLHPKWQYLLYDLLETMHEATKNQFIIATHSPSFITPKTLGKMIRIARMDKASEPTKLDASCIGTPREVLQMVNSHNNERLFFADIVVLVEGIQDRILFEKLLNHFSAEFQSRLVTEVLEVHGKHNLIKYKQLLDASKIKNFIIADRDYAEIVGDSTIKGLFQQDTDRAIDILSDPKSADRETFGREINNAITGGDITRLKDFWGYIVSRSKRFKNPLTSQENTAFKAFIKQQRSNGMFILTQGAIESYLPEGYTSLDKTIELISHSDFLHLMELKAETFAELRQICTAVLGK